MGMLSSYIRSAADSIYSSTTESIKIIRNIIIVGVRDICHVIYIINLKILFII